MGRNPDWKLEKIVVIDRTPGAGNREYVFFCGRSFRKKDGTMTRTLPEEPLEDQSEYRITVVTQNKRGERKKGEHRTIRGGT